eukprot:GHVU01117334.1.p1 GENE.GHVU01117334.1~~GHVU01117334.1.p1  ORF type:complete len:315 (-),score=51.81 GHVU01117334.1:787-1731(-)
MGVKGFFKSLIFMLISCVALIALLTGYAFLGAYIFTSLEGPYETHEKTDLVALREEVTQAIYDAAQQAKNGSDWRDDARQQLQRYEEALQSAFAQGVSTDPDTEVWDFWGSLVYAATVFTTIGYGHIAPVTDYGRIATMIYALVGIPLCLVVMAGLGRAETRILKCLWAPFARLLSPSKVKQLSCVMDPKTKKQVIVEEEVDNVYSVDEEFNLPPIIALFVMALYLAGGAFLYSEWEGWSLLDSLYFIFISTSTIGFGDVLPDQTTFMLATQAYLLFGLSLVAMVLNVLTEAVDAACSKSGSVLLADDRKVKTE